MNNESQVLNIPIEDIIPNRFQPRLNFDDAGLKELAASIKEHGIIQPLVVRKIGEKYEIIAGERRYKASKMAGLTSVPAVVTIMDDKKSAEAAIVENIQRRDLSAIEEAKSYESLLEKGYVTQDELAKKMGLSQSAISNKLRLLTLSDNVQKALMEGKISERHARSLLQLKTKEEQDKWLNIILEERITVKELDSRLKESMNNNNNNNNNNNINNVEQVAPIVNVNLEQPNVNAKKVMPEANPIPNKFFNFLEDEQANMSTKENVNTNTFKIEEKVETPVTNNNQISDDVEMLDFMPDSSTSNISSKDMSIAKELINKLKSDLNSNGYELTILEDDDTDTLKYVINISKN